LTSTRRMDERYNRTHGMSSQAVTMWTMVCKWKIRGKGERRFDSVWRRSRKGATPSAPHPNVTGSLSRAPLVGRIENLEALRVAVEGKQKNDGEKGDGSTTTRHDDERRSVVRNR
jgi:hypothetical protein